MKRNRLLLIVTTVIMLFVLTACGNVKVSKSSADYAGLNVQEVSDELSKLGFKNVSTEEIADLPSKGEVKDGTVESVTIDGTAFDAGGSFSKEAAVNIVYHTIKTLPLPIGADEISGKDYKEIGKLLTDSGFTGVKAGEVDDIDPEGVSTDPYNEMTVSGSADFKKGDLVPFDADIAVNHHVPYEIFDVKVNVDFVPNLIFDTYRVEFFVDNRTIKALDHGEDYEGEMRLKAGAHDFRFRKIEGSETVEGEEEIEITSNSQVNLSISCRTDHIVVTVDSIFKESDVGEGQVRIDFTGSDLFGKDHKEVVDKLKAMGFTNVTEQPLYDIVFGITTEGSCDYVSINGSTDYKKGDIFDKEVEVIVPYHLKVEDDPNRPKEDIESVTEGTTDNETAEETELEAEEPEETEPEETLPEILTPDNCEDLYDLLYGDDEYDTFAAFAEKYEGKKIKFDGSVDYIALHGNFKTRFDLLLSADDYSEDSQTGPTFKIENVNANDLGYGLDDLFDVFPIGTNVEITAFVDRFVYNTGIFYIRPVEITER